MTNSYRYCHKIVLVGEPLSGSCMQSDNTWKLLVEFPTYGMAVLLWNSCWYYTTFLANNIFQISQLTDHYVARCDFLKDKKVIEKVEFGVRFQQPIYKIEAEYYIFMTKDDGQNCKTKNARGLEAYVKRNLLICSISKVVRMQIIGFCLISWAECSISKIGFVIFDLWTSTSSSGPLQEVRPRDGERGRRGRCRSSTL